MSALYLRVLKNAEKSQIKALKFQTMLKYMQGL